MDYSRAESASRITTSRILWIMQHHDTILIDNTIPIDNTHTSFYYYILFTIYIIQDNIYFLIFFEGNVV